MLLLIFYGRGLYLLFRLGHLLIKYAKIHTVWLFSQPPRFLHTIKQTNVGAPRHVFDCFPVGCIVHKLVESLFDIVMLELLAFFCVIRNVACNIGRRFEADRSVHFNKPHSAVEVEAEQLS